MDSGTFPQEVRIEDRAVSFTKGCYPGQETMARLKSMGHVNRLLVGLLLEGPAQAGATLRTDGKEAGRVTTVCDSPTLGKGAALAMVRAEVAKAGTKLQVENGPGAIVADLPLVPAAAAVPPRNP
jgi:folate-binding protein YgfZ